MAADGLYFCDLDFKRTARCAQVTSTGFRLLITAAVLPGRVCNTLRGRAAWGIPHGTVRQMQMTSRVSYRDKGIEGQWQQEN
jgi:hypothetical protein